MAARATETEAKESLAGDISRVVENRVPLSADVPEIVFVDAVPKKGGRGKYLAVARSNLVAGKLEADKLIVRPVAIEAVDHPITIRPGVGAKCVLIVAVAFRKSYQIQPVLSPALAVSWTCQQRL